MFELCIPEELEEECAALQLDRLEERTAGWPELCGLSLPIPLCICTTAEMIELNSSFRQKTKSTDVLSWVYTNAQDEDIEVPPEQGVAGGEIAICLPHCLLQAQENGWGADVECLRLLAHGLAHIMGYDHHSPAEEKAMLAIEKKLLQAAGLPALYPE